MFPIRKTIPAILFGLLCLQATAQNSKALIHRHPELSAGYYRSYAVCCSDSTAASRPEGYAPFYISHYGRHGSRWHSSERKYKPVLEVLEKAGEAGALTAKGKELLEKVRIIAADAEGHYGDLSPRGVREHRAIAERMYLTYPEVFAGKNGRPAKVDSRSTVVVRCILSMAANNERLKEFRPELQMTRESSRRNMYYMGNHHHSDSLELFRQAAAVSDSLRAAWIHPQRFLNSIFSDRRFVRKEISRPQVWMYDVFQLAGGMDSVDYLNIDLFSYFTDRELYDLWRCINAYAYMTMGPSLRFGRANLEDAKPLLRNILTTADQVLSGELDQDATLRFGHDSNIIPLLSLIGEQKVAVRVSLDEVEKAWNLSEVSSMATNLQLIFFRPENGPEHPAANQIKVRVLYNERDAQLPIEGAPFYNWDTLRNYLQSRLDKQYD